MDVSENWHRAYIEYPNFLKEFEEKKEENPGWNLKIRLVIPAKGVQNSDLAITNFDDLPVTCRDTLNICPVTDTHGDGIYTRCLSVCEDILADSIGNGYRI